mmetsp:Transcript_22626/g.70158  ORF Transcript_22626/g.70158 Transcript_22626/m.70158 type:complete len:246 (+) Transcript_22626:1034-1771(+)
MSRPALSCSVAASPTLRRSGTRANRRLQPCLRHSTRRSATCGMRCAASSTATSSPSMAAPPAMAPLFRCSPATARTGTSTCGRSTSSSRTMKGSSSSCTRPWSGSTIAPSAKTLASAASPGLSKRGPSPAAAATPSEAGAPGTCTRSRSSPVTGRVATTRSPVRWSAARAATVTLSPRTSSSATPPPGSSARSVTTVTASSATASTATTTAVAAATTTTTTTKHNHVKKRVYVRSAGGNTVADDA